MNSMKFVILLHFYFMKTWLQTMLWHHTARVNSHQRWKQMRFRVCFHLWCELTNTMNVTEWQVSWNSWYYDFELCITTLNLSVQTKSIEKGEVMSLPLVFFSIELHIHQKFIVKTGTWQITRKKFQLCKRYQLMAHLQSHWTLYVIFVMTFILGILSGTTQKLGLVSFQISYQ